MRRKEGADQFIGIPKTDVPTCQRSSSTFQGIQCIPGTRFTVTLVSLCTDWYHADIWDQTPPPHTKNSTCLLLLLYPQKLLDAVNYILWAVRWCLCNYPVLYSEIKFEWGLEKFIKRTYLNSHICFQNSGRPSGSAAGWLYGMFFCLCI